MERRVGVEEWADCYVVSAGLFDGQDIVDIQRFRLPKDNSDPVYTTKGMIKRNRIHSTMEFSENDNEMLLRIVRRLDGEIVGEDRHLILKRPSVVASALVGDVG